MPTDLDNTYNQNAFRLFQIFQNGTCFWIPSHNFSPTFAPFIIIKINVKKLIILFLSYNSCLYVSLVTLCFVNDSHIFESFFGHIHPYFVILLLLILLDIDHNKAQHQKSFAPHWFCLSLLYIECTLRLMRKRTFVCIVSFIAFFVF